MSSEKMTELPDGIEVPDKLYFRIGEVAQLVGVDAHVLRYWETEFKMKPHRSSSGQRLYRKQDLARFYRIKSLLHGEGYTIAGARRILNGSATDAAPANAERIRDAIQGLQRLRLRIQAFRDEMDPNQG
jgi:DNA-binding transcriptional MerR regulator